MVTKTLVRVSDGAIMSTVAVTAPNDENRNNHQPPKRKDDGSRDDDEKEIAVKHHQLDSIANNQVEVDYNMSATHVTKKTDEKKSSSTRRSSRRKRPVVLEDTDEDADSDKKKRRRKQGGKKLKIDLKDVPMQVPILKHDGKKGGLSSKYVGVYWDKSAKKWQTKITIDGKLHYIGIYDSEEVAAIDYARAVFKYKGGSDGIEYLKTKQREKFDLTHISMQQLIMKPNGKGSSTSKYLGVSLNKASNKWRAQIMIDGKQHYIGMYDKEEVAAKAYARAVLKHKGGSDGIERVKVKAQQQIKASLEKIDLNGVPNQQPILKHDGMKGGLSSKYLGVHWDKSAKKWKSSIRIDGKLHYIGIYDNEEDAATDYARAVFKYKGGSDGIEYLKTQQRSKASLEKIDVTGVPKQQLIMKPNGKGRSTSMYKGVHLEKKSNKWKTEITIDGKKRHVGMYYKEEDAAADYARAVFKYKGGNAEVKRHDELQQPLDLIQIPVIPPAGNNPFKEGPISALKVPENEI